jgi:membrane peptidoglycan carboxypeptidase
MWAAVIGSIWYARDIIIAVPAAEELRRIGSMDQATTLFDRTDKPAFTIFKEQRIEVPLARVSPHLVDAILAIEDQRFYDHNGIDVVRVAGAALSNLREGRLAQGGSTITQQLARQSFLTTEKTYRRKLTEIVVAARLEGQFNKDEILQLYLNKVNPCPSSRAHRRASCTWTPTATSGFCGWPTPACRVDAGRAVRGEVCPTTAHLRPRFRASRRWPV